VQIAQALDALVQDIEHEERLEEASSSIFGLRAWFSHMELDSIKIDPSYFQNSIAKRKEFPSH
jgi:uncharacterized protein YfaT (DUF1175 family)